MTDHTVQTLLLVSGENDIALRRQSSVGVIPPVS